jgi:hypothetical protein
VRNFLMPRSETRLFRWLWRATIVTACAHGALFTWSIYRRLRQITRVDIILNSTTLASGDSVGYDVVASGEVQNLIRLELIQGDLVAVVHEQRAQVNRFSGYDPRRFRYTPKIAITPDLLSRFKPGPAKLRLTGFGGQKLLQTPAPRVREVEVRLTP